MVRAVRERRRQIGILRSLGFSGVAVRRAFVAESSFVALEGTGIGVALALVVSWRLVTNSSFGDNLTYSIPLIGLAVLIGTTLVASLIATGAPAIQASRIRPAVALRLAD
jgi:putative ABC transport system permease protein